MSSVETVRALAMAMPEAVEADHHGFPSARVRGKIFCTYRHTPARLMVKLDPEDQRNLCEGYGDLLTPVAGYWGRKGSTLVDVERVDDGFLATLLRLAWSNVAPRSLKAAA